MRKLLSTAAILVALAAPAYADSGQPDAWRAGSHCVAVSFQNAPGQPASWFAVPLDPTSLPLEPGHTYLGEAQQASVLYDAWKNRTVVLFTPSASTAMCRISIDQPAQPLPVISNVYPSS